mmetsp:Transcript_30269/g.61720  ORF Transcript_30269/g.61720 Transcript_30269/m.61720 type:complete len:186 (-) Transcript_30269:470-1027(-)|eukprot:CAMPEP_0183323386 /NCGR_PEP_ID=MMETSP0160_2-20130417/74254_1 /TAXON_ID=2839 ORGANISM="Odontella Sinensis, Strain Grunow 1884" /NCGR_SAMPLE_ID=MMETSP0160_2 /ASSEMBLY_ACC=CAM_ASM_000250 /LENGTH=185 /DNA_ID=CAMNT_0025490747 /DNA_START=1 /DNA_END=558 /DNA_ORIENTATION=+
MAKPHQFILTAVLLHNACVLLDAFSPLYLDSLEALSSEKRDEYSTPGNSQPGWFRRNNIRLTCYLDNLKVNALENKASNYGDDVRWGVEVYLDSFASQNEEESVRVTSQGQTSRPPVSIPEEHYSKDHPMAGWAGYADRRWGNYLENLKQDSFEDEGVSDDGRDLRLGAGAYLSSIASSPRENST